MQNKNLAPTVDPFSDFDPSSQLADPTGWRAYGSLLTNFASDIPKLFAWLGSDLRSSQHVAGLLTGSVLVGRPDLTEAVWSFIQQGERQYDAKNITNNLPGCDAGSDVLIGELSKCCSKDQLSALHAYLLCPVEHGTAAALVIRRGLLFSAAKAAKVLPNGQPLFDELWDNLKPSFLTVEGATEKFISDHIDSDIRYAIRHILSDPECLEKDTVSLIISLLTTEASSLPDWPLHLIKELLPESRLEKAWPELVKNTEWGILNQLAHILPTPTVALWTRRAQDEILKSEAPLLHAALLNEAISEKVSTNEARPRTQSKM